MTSIEPYFTFNNIILYKGDCLEIMPQLNIKFDCCITDLPYGTVACKWDTIIPF
jgi:site-specific DNA-methyltransferase (adenine-specific)